MGVHIERPDGDGPFPVVVFFHHGPGLDDGAKKTMARIAEWGYYVISHDRYHRAEPWYTMKSRADDEMKKMFGLVMGTSESAVGDDLSAVLAWLPNDPAARTGSKGVIGYCIGARSVLCTIRDHGAEFRAAAGLHPSFCTTDAPDSPHRAVSSYTGSLYIGFGSADTMQPASANAALIDATNALAKGEAEIHEGADHGFGVFGPAYHDAAATRSYERVKAMFDRELKGA
jgi:carboxymethylenebutenolidase